MSKELKNMTHEELILKINHLKSKEQDWMYKEQDWMSRERYLQFRIDQLNRLLFGSKRERFISNQQIEGQMELPFEVEEKPVEEEKLEQITYTRKKKQRPNHPGRIALPDHLPVEEILLEPKEDTAGLKCIGKEVTDKLEFIPAKLFIKRYISPKYIKPEDDQKLDYKGIISELPVFPIEKGIAGAGLLAQIMVDKYVDHLPLGQGYLQVDETPIRVLDKDVKGKCHQGYYWVYNTLLQQAVLFDYRKGRGRDGPREMLQA